MSSLAVPATVSAVLIVKDEEDVLDASLSALGWVDEIVVYDTGSTDATLDVARSYTDAVVEGYWDDDFGAARNRAIAHATGNWVLIVDADEIYHGDPSAARRRLATADADGIDRFVIPVRSGDTAEDRIGGDSVNVRVFRRDRYHYVGRLHEQVAPRDGVEVPGGIGTFPDTRLDHSGYGQEALRKHNKLERNLQIARRDLAEAKSNGADAVQIAVLDANLARALCAVGEHGEALELGATLLDGGLVPGGTLVLLAQSMVAAATELERQDDVERWLDAWTEADYSPYWALAARARLAAARGDAEQALGLLDQIPTTAVDRVGRRFTKHDLAAVEIWALAARERPGAAVRRAIAAARAGYPSASPHDIVKLCQAGKRSVSEFVEALDTRIWRHYAVWAASEPTGESREFLRTMRDVRRGDPTVLLCAAGLASSLTLEELAEWAAEIRKAGLADICPLVAAANDAMRDFRTRALAAAMAVDIYADARALPGLEEALADVPSELEHQMLAELDVVAPGLVTAS